MAERIDPDTVQGIPDGAPRKYPWDEWMDGSCWLLRAGVDYKTATRNFQATAFKHAKRHGCDLHTRQVEGGITVQFTPKAADKEDEK